MAQRKFEVGAAKKGGVPVNNFVCMGLYGKIIKNYVGKPRE